MCMTKQQLIWEWFGYVDKLWVKLIALLIPSLLSIHLHIENVIYIGLRNILRYITKYLDLRNIRLKKGNASNMIVYFQNHEIEDLNYIFYVMVFCFYIKKGQRLKSLRCNFNVSAIEKFHIYPSYAYVCTLK